jgi:hypothetical protein
VCIQIGAMDKGVHGDWRVDAPPGVAETAPCSAPERPAKRRRSPSDYKVITDLPPTLPVTEAELELLEHELADFIAELMKK